LDSGGSTNGHGLIGIPLRFSNNEFPVPPLCRFPEIFYLCLFP
jgi:hypothetical protein